MNVGVPNRAGDCLLLRGSEMSIVAMMPGKVKTGVAKGHYCKSNFLIANNIVIGFKRSSKRRSLKAGRAVQKGQALDDRGRKS